MELLALQSGTYENRPLARRCQGDFTEHASKVSLSQPETQGKEMRVIIYSWASTAQRLLNQWYGVHCWCSAVKMFTICVTLSLLWTLMEPSNIKAWGWGTKTWLNRSTLKSLLAVYYIRKSWRWMKNGSKPNQSSFWLSSGGLHRAGLLCPGGLVLSYQAQTNPLGRKKQISFGHKRAGYTPKAS